jgi:hypothetical protein
MSEPVTGRVDYIDPRGWGRLLLTAGGFAHFDRRDYAGPWPPPWGATVRCEVVERPRGRHAIRVQL